MSAGNDIRELLRLCEIIKEWWEAHKYDTSGVDHNTYDDEPEFVKAAKKIIGDWEEEK